MYIVCLLFALSAILTYFDPLAGIKVILVLLLLADLFIEYTGMINPKWHPILSIVNKLTGHPKMDDGEDPVDTKEIEEEKKVEKN